MKHFEKLTIAAAVLALSSPLAHAQSPALSRMAAPKLVGRVDSTTPISFALTLPPRDPAGLGTFLDRLYDPADPLYHHFLTPAQFTAEFGPIPADYAALEAAAVKAGLTVTTTYPGRTLLDVEGPASAVESLLGVHLNAYVDADGNSYHVPDATPQTTGTFAALGASAIGVDDVPAASPHISRSLVPSLSGSPEGLTPVEVKRAYDMPANLTGAGQTLAVMELDGYNPSDIQTYRNEFGITGTPLSNILVDSASGIAGQNTDEVVLDIDMILTFADDANELLVYEAPNSNQGALDCYTRIAGDNTAKIVSTSWGAAENAEEHSFIESEATVFEQMAAQGQSVFASAGDDGAFDNPSTPSTLAVDDPASQPDVTSCGATSLTLDPLGDYESESTWNNKIGSGGGGASSAWPMPAYQVEAGLTGSARLVPDVSINADPNNGYAIFLTQDGESGWEEVGGTSASAPLWAGVTALVNQEKGSNIGEANPSIYADASAPVRYTRDFHDIADGSNNNHYTATEGFDETTGWGTPIGSLLIPDMAAVPSTNGSTVDTIDAGLQFFSVPFEDESVAFGDIFSQAITVYYWDPVTNAYVSSPNPPAEFLHQGVGYWARFSAATAVTNAGLNLSSGATSLSIELVPGWNMVGDPFDLTIPLGDVSISPIDGGSSMSLAEADADGYVYYTLYSYNSATNSYVAHSSDSLTPYTGYWIKAFQPCKLTVTE